MGVGLMHAVGLSGCPTAHLEARSVPWSPRNISGRSTPLLTQRGRIEENKGEPVCRIRSTLKEVSPRDLTCRVLPKDGGFLCQQQPWPFLHTSLFCAPSIISQALRAAMVAAEVPLRGKLRAEATTSSTHALILQVPLRVLASTVVQGLILCCRPRIAPCSTHGQNCRGKPRLFCWVRVFDLESGGARCARRP